MGGNHDPLAAFHLGDYLKAWVRRHKRLTIDNGPAFRKWFEWGTVGLGFCHGNAGKLEEYGMKMAAEQAPCGAVRNGMRCTRLTSITAGSLSLTGTPYAFSKSPAAVCVERGERIRRNTRRRKLHLEQD